MTDNALLAENLYLKKELAEKERIINNYRAIFKQDDIENIENIDSHILKNWYKDFKETPQQGQRQEKPSLIDKILDHLPKWMFKEEEE